MHWTKQYPHESKNNSTNFFDISDDENDFENVQIILMTPKMNNNEFFVTEMLCSAVIDIACSKTVAKKKCFDNYYTKMPDGTSLNKIDLFQSHAPFKLSDDQKI